jgi:predicted DNA-binding transcriptional regulator AlpA
VQKEGVMSYTSNQEILSERDVSNWLGISEPTLFRHRRDGTGPKFIRLSARRVAYRRGAIEEWLRSREQQPVGAAARAHATSDELRRGHNMVQDGQPVAEGQEPARAASFFTALPSRNIER